MKEKGSPPCMGLVMIAKKHDDATSNDVEASPLLPEDSCNSSARNPSLGAAAHLHFSSLIKGEKNVIFLSCKLQVREEKEFGFAL